ncbi:MAG TPA: prepilin-type N-terminal cleavage/methylation domain-containing protein [Mycobacterium sp.]|nr:prepilin-type N-terminal cleavage/methylation domain-containing protein [Mycobacterium sp.]
MKNRTRQRGVSLMEVLAAMVLFALVASAIGALATQSMVHTVRNRHSTNASLIAQQELERLRGLDYVDLASSTSTKSMAGQTYTVVSNVASNTPATSMSTITVTVSWDGPEGARSYVVQTIFTSIDA